MTGRLTGAIAAGVLIFMGLPAAAADTVEPEVETDPVEIASDAADDAAIWPHPSVPSLSLVIGTDKRAGAVEVYDLAGARLQRISGARANGVDLRRGVTVGGRAVDLVAVGGDDVRFYRVDPDARRLVGLDIGQDGSRVDPNGLCLYRSPVSGRVYMFGISLQSEVDHLEIVDNGGKIDLVPVRKTWDVGHDSEACVADDELGHLYINEADVALWKYGAESDAGTAPAQRRAVDKVGGGRLVADIEGLTLVYQPGGGGYLIASSQGEDAFAVYRRAGDNAFERKFKIEGNRRADGCSNTDGIDALAADLGPAFPHGMFVCQDHHNSSPNAGNQNFKFVRLEKAVELDPAPTPAVPPPAPPGPADPPPAATPEPERSDAPRPGPTPVPTGRSGYWMLGSDGAAYAFGDAAPGLGDAAARLPAGAAAVDVEATPSGDGYWIADDRGTVHAFGDARHLGDADPSSMRPGEQVTSLSATPSGAGYWLFTSLGRTLAFGDAGLYGDMAGTALNGQVLDSIPTPTGRGYYMVAADGGIFTFGDARFSGSMGDQRLNAPVVSVVPDPDGAGYWLVASDGGVFAFDAPFRGSMGATRLNAPVTGMVPFGKGYLMVAADGGIFNFSDRAFAGSLGGDPPAKPITSVTALR